MQERHDDHKTESHITISNRYYIKRPRYHHKVWVVFSNNYISYNTGTLHTLGHCVYISGKALLPVL